MKKHKCLAFELSIERGDYLCVNVKYVGLRFKGTISGLCISFCPFCKQYLYNDIKDTTIDELERENESLKLIIDNIGGLL